MRHEGLGNKEPIQVAAIAIEKQSREAENDSQLEAEI